MNCEIFRKYLDEYVRGTLDSSLGNDLGEHMAGCAACRAEYNEHNALLSILNSKSEIAIEPADLDDFLPGVWHKIEKGKSRRRIWFFRLVPAALAAVLLAMFVFRSDSDKLVYTGFYDAADSLESHQTYSALIGVLFGNEAGQQLDIVEQELDSYGSFVNGYIDDDIFDLSLDDLVKLESKLKELKNNKG